MQWCWRHFFTFTYYVLNALYRITSVVCVCSRTSLISMHLHSNSTRDHKMFCVQTHLCVLFFLSFPFLLFLLFISCTWIHWLVASLSSDLIRLIVWLVRSVSTRFIWQDIGICSMVVGWMRSISIYVEKEEQIFNGFARVRIRVFFINYLLYGLWK